jgi:hypothetical protein
VITARPALALAALVLVAAACGGGDDDATATSTATTVTTTAPAATTSPPTTEAPTTSTPPSTAPVTTEVPDTTLPPVPSTEELDAFTWTERLPDAPWAARAGLRVVELEGRLFLMGGRTPNESTIPGDSTIWADVWASDDGGATWTQLVVGDEPGMWPARAYFQAVVHDDAIVVLGGQDFGLQENPFCALLEQGLEPPPGLGIDPDAPCPEFLPSSQFFDDVWRSSDGITWEAVTEDAPWDGRAGLSAAVLGDQIYVLAGSKNDDSAIVGAGGPQRIYFNDVWRSADGAEWELVTDAAPWEPRAGAAVVVRDDRLYVLGGEDGFTCEPLPDCEPPYFNDVWSTVDGAEWELVTEAAGWSPRPGHVCELVGDQFVCFGGFGLIENPTDVWASPDGATWTELSTPPWNVADPSEVKYDFDALVVDDPVAGPTVLTFGGDRETFDFTDPENFRRVDDDVWAFAAPG